MRRIHDVVIRFQGWKIRKNSVFPIQYEQSVFKQNILVKGKVKCTLVQALRLCTGRTAHRGSRGIALPFHDYGTKRGWGVRVTPRPLFTPGKDPVPIVQEAGWAPWAGLDRCGKSRPPPGFDPRTVQPVAGRYTVYATRPTNFLVVK